MYGNDSGPMRFRYLVLSFRSGYDLNTDRTVAQRASSLFSDPTFSRRLEPRKSNSNRASRGQPCESRSQTKRANNSLSRGSTGPSVNSKSLTSSRGSKLFTRGWFGSPAAPQTSQRLWFGSSPPREGLRSKQSQKASSWATSYTDARHQGRSLSKSNSASSATGSGTFPKTAPKSKPVRDVDNLDTLVINAKQSPRCVPTAGNNTAPSTGAAKLAPSWSMTRDRPNKLRWRSQNPQLEQKLSRK